MNIAVVGGGISGLMAAEHWSDLGHRVSLFEKGLLCLQISLKSLIMLYGGIRYLENYHFNEVKESLKCRHLCIKKFKENIKVKRFFIPVYKNTSKSLLRLYAVLRPIVKSSSAYSKASRDSMIVKQNKIIGIFEGKWASENVIVIKVNKFISS